MFDAWKLEILLGMDTGWFFGWLLMGRNLFELAIAFFVLFPIYYCVINIIRETLIYLAFGRTFTWDWLKIFIKPFFRNKDHK